ncbi:hypothetical protein BC936DRAFT_143068 [Jimgerdemannia flammicorona]|uniref:RNA ligase domain-containing protein n=1 Tax=Jimgerdemannia flammicorona TaxID=994334 RepID=A0A433DEH4_9FUNG|nr:hypothetical protein BC936DRAFT_143068 [Jimgerdemannia flammicorona]
MWQPEESGATNHSTNSLLDGTATCFSSSRGEQLLPNHPHLDMSHRLPDFHKYPRTPHLFNTGGTAVTLDDLVHDMRSNALFFNPPPHLRLTIEEKIDGANLGVAVGPDYGLTVQNRSHHVTAAHHPQFKMLPNWLAEWGGELYTLLMEPELEGGEEEVQPGERILYGEWMVAQHSIYYTRLPAYFVAFDLYDTKHGKFFSRKRFRAIMRCLAPSIPIVPAIEIPPLAKTPTISPPPPVDSIPADSIPADSTAAHPIPADPATSTDPAESLAIPAALLAVPPDSLLTPATILDLLQLKSSYAPDVTIEGVYLRLDEGDWAKHRAKVVRPDFIPGNQHWSKRAITKNRLRAYGGEGEDEMN